MELTMPRNYAVLSADEMTYVDGGAATVVDILLDGFVPFCGLARGLLATYQFKKDYMAKKPNATLDQVAAAGIDALVADMNADTLNLIDDALRAFSVVSSQPFGIIGMAVIALV